MQTAHDTLDGRLSQLERAHRRRGRVLAALAIGSAALVMAGQAAPRQAESLELRDADGEVYASLTHDADRGASLVLRDGHGRDRLSLRVATDGTPGIVLADRGRAQRVELSLLDEATPRLVLRDDAGTERAKLLLMPEGSPLLYLKDATGANRVELVSLWTGLNGLVIFDPEQRPVCLLSAAPEAGAGLSLADGAGTARLRVGLDAEGEPSVQAAGADGAISWRIPEAAPAPAPAPESSDAPPGE